MAGWFALVTCVLAGLVGCGGVEASRGPACGETDEQHLECQREVGFDSVDGFTMSDVVWIDQHGVPIHRQILRGRTPEQPNMKCSLFAASPPDVAAKCLLTGRPRER